MKYLILTLLTICTSSSYAEFRFHCYHGAEHSNINSFMTPLGANYVGDISNNGSSFGIDVSWGRSLFQSLSFDATSSTKLFPPIFGNNDEGILAIKGTIGLIHNISIKIGREEYSALGEVTGTIPYYRNGIPMSPGDTFKMSTTVNKYLVSYKYIFQPSDNMPDESYVVGGIGFADIEEIGVRSPSYSNLPAYCEAEVPRNYTAMLMELRIMYGSIGLGSFGNAYGACNCEVWAGKSGCVKGGYEIGLFSNISDSFWIQPYVGGYFWKMVNIDVTDIEYQPIDSDFAYSIGIRWDLRI